MPSVPVRRAFSVFLYSGRVHVQIRARVKNMITPVYLKKMQCIKNNFLTSAWYQKAIANVLALQSSLQITLIILLLMVTNLFTISLFCVSC